MSWFSNNNDSHFIFFDANVNSGRCCQSVSKYRNVCVRVGIDWNAVFCDVLFDSMGVH